MSPNPPRAAGGPWPDLRVLALGCVMAACSPDGGAPDQAGFRIDRFKPDLREPVFLNQPITVYFTDDVDPSSVTPDTFALLDESGVPAAIDRLETGTRSVTLHPLAPLSPGLDDGSLRPATAYTLLAAGYPRSNAIRARDGSVLARSAVVPLRAVPDTGIAGYPSPLLPVGRADQPFALDPLRPPSLTADGGTLWLHFTIPPSPTSITSESFLVHRFQDRVVRVPVERARAVPAAGDPFRGCSVELLLDRSGFHAADHVAVQVVSQGPHALTDYRGRVLSSLPFLDGPIRLAVRAGTAPAALGFDPGHTLAWVPARLDGPGFEWRQGRLSPQVRLECGDGRHGFLHPTASTRLEIPGDGSLQVGGIHVPSGVRLTLTSRAAVRLQVAGSVRIDGELILETPPSPTSDLWPGQRLAVSELEALVGCAMVVAGSIAVGGRIEHASGADAALGPPLALVAGGAIDLRGRVPPRSLLSSEVEVRGSAEAARVVRVPLSLGWPGPPGAEAAAYTAWQLVGVADAGSRSLCCDGVFPVSSVVVEVEVAPAHPIDRGRPDERRELRRRAALGEPVTLAAGDFVRFTVRAPLAPGTELPTIRRAWLAAGDGGAAHGDNRPGHSRTGR